MTFELTCVRLLCCVRRLRVSQEYKGRLSVVKLDGHRWGEHAKHFGLSGSLPGIVVEDRENNKNFGPSHT